ncbi:MAG: hypothetical protein EOO07_11410 [Chitinophagaceae bacterium]|nr:MAG: hypothetical protein EOO07_11410 [Chitinophagaceae bacterium]
MAINPKVSLAAGIVFISFYPIFIKLADEPAITAAFYRIFIGLVLLTPYCVSKGLLKINRNDLLVALLAGMVFAADIACWNISILKISATISTVLANLAPVWVGLISLLVLKKPSGWLFWVGTLIAIIGMVILVGYDNILHLQISIGVAMAVLCSVFYGIYILLTKGT